MRVALYQPEIAGNVGAVLRMAACFGVAVDVIEPCGFVWSDAKLKRAGMDYLSTVALARHADWPAFVAADAGRLVLLTTKATTSLYDHVFTVDDRLLFGSESSGVPGEVAKQCGVRLRIPLVAGVRSLNLAVAAGIATAEALRQTGSLPRC